jgi:hypothetical protein
MTHPVACWRYGRGTNTREGVLRRGEIVCPACAESLPLDHHLDLRLHRFAVFFDGVCVGRFSNEHLARETLRMKKSLFSFAKMPPYWITDTATGRELEL